MHTGGVAPATKSFRPYSAPYSAHEWKSGKRSWEIDVHTCRTTESACSRSEIYQECQGLAATILSATLTAGAGLSERLHCSASDPYRELQIASAASDLYAASVRGNAFVAHNAVLAYAHASVPKGEPAHFPCPRGDPYLCRTVAPTASGASGSSLEHGGAPFRVFLYCWAFDSAS